MLLIIYDKSDLGTIDYIKYLEFKKVNFISIEATDLVTNYSIYDDGVNVIWKSNSVEIDFSQISSIYYRLHELNINLFKDYIEEDRFYVKKEWESYLIYRMNKFPNVISLPNLYVLSSVIMQYPFYYSIAQALGIKVPYYFLSSDFTEIKEKFEKKEYEYILRSNVYNNSKFKSSSILEEDTYGIIEKPKGEIILVDIVGNKIFACKGSNQKKVDIGKYEKKNLINLAKKLGLKLVQIIMIENDKELILMQISAYPNYLKYNVDIRNKIYKEITILV
jgi:hypothetical protein